MGLRFTITDQLGNNTIIDEPLGWDTINLHYIRHKDWHGFIDTVDDTVGSLQFYGNGYQILKTSFETHGVEAQCGFLVEFQCSDTDSYDTIYQGQFSFYKYKEVQGLNGCHIECSVESSNNVMVLKNRYDQKVDLNSTFPFQTPTNPYTISLNQIQAKSTTQQYPPNPNTGIDTLNTGDTYLVPILISGSTWPSGTSGQIATWSDSGSWTYTSATTGQVLIDLSTDLGYIYGSTTDPGLPTGWSLDTQVMTSYPALGAQVLLPSKTLRLTTEAIVNPNVYNTNGVNSGSSFTFNNTGRHRLLGFSNTANSVWSMQLGWSGGVITQDVPAFTGADPDIWAGQDLHSASPDPIFTYTPDINFTSPMVNVSVNISGSITTTNDSGSPAHVDSMKAILCHSTSSYGDALGNAAQHIAMNSQIITAGSGTGGSSPYTTSKGLNPINFSFVVPETSVAMAPGSNVYLVFEFDFHDRTGPGTGGGGYACSVTTEFYGTATFSIDSSYNSTAAPIYLINESLSRTTEAITGGEIQVYSDFFGRTDAHPQVSPADGEGGLLAITNGLLIRGQTMLNGSQPPMPVSLKELFEALNAIYNIGMCIENHNGTNRLRIELLNHFYQNATILRCDNVDEIHTEIEAEKFYGKFRTGYSKWQGEQQGGLDDFMNKREYRTALSTSKSVLEKYCGFIGSSYALETTRRQGAIGSQDWRFDHENFLICMERPSSQQQQNSPTAAILGTVNILSREKIDDTTNAHVQAVDSGGTPVVDSGGAAVYVQQYYIDDSVDVPIVSHGSGYSSISPPRITITDNNNANAVVGSGYGTVVGGQVMGAPFDGFGTWDYNPYPTPSAPPPTLTVSIDAPTPSVSVATAQATVDSSGGETDSCIAEISVTNAGLGYTIPPIVQITAPTNPHIGSGGIQASAVATINSNGSVIYIQVTNEGYGYLHTPAPMVTLTLPPVQALIVEQNALTTASLVRNKTIVDPKTLYNYRISPARNAMRWLRSIAQSYADWVKAVLHFVSGEANITASGQYAGIAGTVPVMENNVVAEDDNITYDMFDQAHVTDYYPLYNNELVKFTYPLSYSDWKNLSLNPYGRICYTVNGGTDQYGWIEDLKYSPFEGTAEFVLKKQIS